MPIQRAAKTRSVPTKAMPLQSEEVLKTEKPQVHPASIVQRAKHAPSSLSPTDVFQLQGVMGNQAVLRLLTSPTISAAPVMRQILPLASASGGSYVQRDGDEDGDAPLIGSGASSDEYEGDEEEGVDEETQSKYDKVKAIADKLAEYHAMHKNYQKYAAYIGSKSWSMFKKVWALVEKVVGWVGKVDPSGISKIIAKVSKAVRLIVGYIEEAVRLSDAKLREEVTPLLVPSLSVETVKAAVKEALTLKNVVKTAIDAVVD